MWLRRTRSTSRIHNTTNFSCSSFKDIQTLCADEHNLDPDSPSPNKRTSAVFHRVRRANAVLRALSSHPPDPLTGTKPNDSAGKPPLPLSSSLQDASFSAFSLKENRSEPLISLPVGEKPLVGFPGKEKPLIALPGAEKRIVVYFTSLRVVRSTFEDCKAARSILRALRVFVDERDVSMDFRYMEELKRIMGHKEKTMVTLPRVFIDGRYIGGAEEIRRLNETGELKKAVEGLIPASGTCEVCEGYRFILCEECNGSHKCYSEKGGFRSCMSCNENGLIRCPSCSCAPF